MRCWSRSPLRGAARNVGPRPAVPDPRCGGGIAGRPGRDQPLAADPANPMVPVGSLALPAVVVVTNLVTLELLVAQLVSAQNSEGGALLLAALQVWATSVIAFGLIYWELDRGGPVARTQIHPREKLPLVLSSARFPVHPGRNPGHRHRSRRGIQRKGRLDTRHSWTTCTCPPRTPARSAPPTPCR